MKITKIPGLGRFGVFIDDVDFKNITHDEWLEIGQIHLNSLVTIIRDTKLDPFDYMRFMYQWGTPRHINSYAVSKKYGDTYLNLLERVHKGDTAIDPEDCQWILAVAELFVPDARGNLTGMLKVTGKRKDDGSPLGMFAEGELLWHSNESGNLTFTPAVSLLAHEGVVGSATGFLTTTDWYEKQSESFRSELDEMIVLHRFTPGKINPGLRADQDFVMYKNMCPVDDVKIPMVIQSPAGIKGLHYSVNTVYKIDGMSVKESEKLFKKLDKELFTDEYTYDHWYQNNGDLCLFDNSITLHRRLGGIANRMGYRIQYDYTNLQTKPYKPYFQQEYADAYREEITDMVKVLGIRDFKVPTLSIIERIKRLF